MSPINLLWQAIPAAHKSLEVARFCKIIALSIVCCCLLLAYSRSYAQSEAPVAPKTSDVRILIDISGSMKKNDPENLRRPALDMLIKLLPEGSQAGVWTFGKFTNMLVKHRPVDEAWKQEASQKTQEIGSIAQFTNIGDVLDKAAYDKTYSTRGNYQTHIILLTDGMVDIDRDPAVNERERERILNAILPDYQAVDYKIHTVSLSVNADRQLMDQLALGTGGQSAIAKNADELMQVFLQVFDQAVPKEELPFDGNSFVTDSSIEEFTALIFRKPGTADTELITPDLARYNKNTRDPNLNWYATEQYDLITVKRPFEGEWKVVADKLPESRITVVSDLSLAVKPLPTNLLIDESLALSLALREENNIIDRAEFLELLDIDVMVQALASGNSRKQRLSDGLVPGNGVYQTQLNDFNTVGTYEVVVMVDGKSFQRQFVHRMDVREAFAVDVEPIVGQSPQQYKVMVTPQIKGIDLASTEVVGNLKKPSGASNISNFTLTSASTWEWVMTAEEEGRYSLSIRMTTTTPAGERKSYTPNPFIIEHPQNDQLFARLEPEAPAPEPVPAPVEPLAEKPPAAEPVTPPPAPEPAPETTQETATEAPPEEDSNLMQWILYGVIALVNILIIVIIFILYRKFFKPSSKDDEDIPEDVVEEPEKSTMEEAKPVEELTEPAMDEMNMAEFEDESIEPEPEPEDDIASDLDAALEEAGDPLDDLNPSELDDEDEDPEFDLDDFAPDALDDDDEDEDLKL